MAIDTLIEVAENRGAQAATRVQAATVLLQLRGYLRTGKEAAATSDPLAIEPHLPKPEDRAAIGAGATPEQLAAAQRRLAEGA